jgi:hypothetical protein
MVLNPETKYPNRRAYVLKLRRDATPDTLAGRIENLVTGQQLEFASAHALVAALVDSLVRDLEAASGPQAPDAVAVEGAHADRTATQR